jgi:mycothiol synthase
MIDIRQLKDSDINDLTEICRLGMEFDVWYEKVLREKTVDAADYKEELGIVAEIDGEAAGFAQGVIGSVRGTPSGWVRLLVVHPKFRCRGVGTVLLNEIEARLKKYDVERISIMDVPANYYMPGVDVRYKEAFCFLEKRGYKRGIPNINLVCEVSQDMYDSKNDIERLDKIGFFVRRAENGDWEAIKKFLESNWACWVDEVLSSFDNDPKTLWICVHEEKVVGFCGYDGNNRGLGWFGPMGVDPITRGKGIGAVVCLLCLKDLALLGHKEAIIPWVGPVRFYDKVCNAKMGRHFWTFTKSCMDEK